MLKRRNHNHAEAEQNEEKPERKIINEKIQHRKSPTRVRGRKPIPHVVQDRGEGKQQAVRNYINFLRVLGNEKHPERNGKMHYLVKKIIEHMNGISKHGKRGKRNVPHEGLTVIRNAVAENRIECQDFNENQELNRHEKIPMLTKQRVRVTEIKLQAELHWACTQSENKNILSQGTKGKRDLEMKIRGPKMSFSASGPSTARTFSTTG